MTHLLLFQFHGQLALKSDWDKTCFFLAHINSVDIQIILKLHSKYSIRHAQTSLLDDCARTQKEYNSLMDQIRAKYEHLDSTEYRTVDTPAFKAEACELANLLAHVSQLCQKLNLPTPKELYRLTFFKHWRCFLVLNYRQAVWLGYGGCSFVPIDM